MSSFYNTQTIEASKPAGEENLSKHTQPNICAIPSNADQFVDQSDSSRATGTTSVGNGFISAGKATVKGVTEFASDVGDALGKVQSGIAQAQAIATDPVSFVAGLAEEATGYSIPTSPQGVLDLLSKFSKPPVSSDGRTDISKEKSEGEGIIDEIGDVASLTVDELTGAISSVGTAISEATSAIGEAISPITELASLGGVPVDNVISQSVNKVTSPVQSTLTKVQNVTDGTQGIIT